VCAGFPNRLDYHAFVQTYAFTRTYFTRHTRQRFAHGHKVGGDAAALERRTRTLKQSFVGCSDEQVAQALEACGGHAGRAAKQLAAQPGAASAGANNRRASRRLSRRHRTGGLGSAVTKDRVKRMLTDVFGRACLLARANGHHITCSRTRHRCRLRSSMPLPAHPPHQSWTPALDHALCRRLSPSCRSILPNMAVREDEHFVMGRTLLFLRAHVLSTITARYDRMSACRERIGPAMRQHEVKFRLWYAAPRAQPGL
jgi:hypothetical protein